MNRLGKEKSPYLLQHKDNPVHWNPWDEKALNKARDEGKLLFISIGYSTCHWCHVMNRESFNDRMVGDVLNDYFVPIKVDREERPDIDKVYMEFSQAMTGSGGWPLNVIATPEGKPLTIFTYIPKHSQGRRMGLIDYLKRVNNLWNQKKEELGKDANLIFEEVEEMANVYKEGKIKDDIGQEVFDSLNSIFDEEYGGFGKSPKFPMPQYVLHLLGLGEEGNGRALEIAEKTLIDMYKGGIFDHVGYGFFRYSTDEKWLVPHFEKMLYDNAMLGLVYTRAFDVTGKEIYKEIAEKTYDFIIRDFLSPVGGYYSALDAETDGEEGKYYLFTKEEIIRLLGRKKGEEFAQEYGITDEGNFEVGNIPNLIGKEMDSSGDFKDSIELLQDYRRERTNPHRDEKILTSWNGLLIGSLAFAGEIFGNEFYLEKAEESADFLIKNSMDEDYNLSRTYTSGSSYNKGYLDDYSYLLFGLLNLYKYGGNDKYLNVGEKLMKKIFSKFQDSRNGGMFFSEDSSTGLVLRLKDYHDGAVPSAISFVLLGLKDLEELTGKKVYKEMSKALIYDFGGDINQNPLAYLYSILAYNNFL